MIAKESILQKKKEDTAKKAEEEKKKEPADKPGLSKTKEGSGMFFNIIREYIKLLQQHFTRLLTQKVLLKELSEEALYKIPLSEMLRKTFTEFFSRISQLQCQPQKDSLDIASYKLFITDIFNDCISPYTNESDPINSGAVALMRDIKKFATSLYFQSLILDGIANDFESMNIEYMREVSNLMGHGFQDKEGILSKDIVYRKKRRTRCKVLVKG